MLSTCNVCCVRALAPTFFATDRKKTTSLDVVRVKKLENAPLGGLSEESFARRYGDDSLRCSHFVRRRATKCYRAFR